MRPLLLLAINSALVLTTISFCYGQPRTGKFRGMRVETKPATHEDLVKGAERAFIGKVEEVYSHEMPLDVEIDGTKKSIVFRVRIVQFDVEQVLFDRTDPRRESDILRKGTAFRVTSHEATSRPVKKGERLLWFLSPKSSLGLSQPVGIDSGHFRLTADETTNTTGVVNLKHNRDLVDPSQIGEQEANKIASAVPETEPSEVLEHLRMWQGKQTTGGIADPIPLDVFVGRTKVLLESVKYEHD